MGLNVPTGAELNIHIEDIPEDGHEWTMVAFVVVLTVFAVYSATATGGFTTNIGPKPIWNSTATDKLKHDLLLNYDKFARPAQHFNTTTVTIGLSIRHFDLNEEKSILTTNALFSLEWMDEKLKWNASDYEGLKILHLADHEIWQPDITLYNSAAGSTVDHYGNTHSLVHEDGNVIWVPPAQFIVYCSLNLRTWPFDTQKCALTLGSWTYDGNQIDLQLVDREVNLELLVTNTEWDLVNISKKRSSKYYNCCAEPYVDVTYDLTIKRRSPTYNALIITPAFAIIFMMLLTFWLPPQSGEKILLTSFTLLIICMFLLYFTHRCPMMGDHTPLIILFYSASLYVATFILIGAVVVIWLSRTKHNNSLPWPIKHAITGWLGRLLCLDHYITQTSMGGHRANAEEMRDQQHQAVFDDHSGDEHHIIAPTQRPSCQQEWILLAATIDRLSFAFYSLLFVILAITYSV